MGFVTSSSTVQLFAYLTQYARDRILNGNTSEFQAKYFSLHDEDVNYKITSNLDGTTNKPLTSGFMPDITGDPDICIKSMVSGVLNKNMLVSSISSPTYAISPNKILVNENETVTFTITTQNVSDNTTLYLANVGTTNDNDFTQNINNGTVTINSNTANFTLNIKNDALPDSDETIIIQLKDQSGNVLATADTVIVKDIAITPITAEYITNCLNDNSGNINIRILGPNGGSGGPYTWKALPVDSVGNQVNLFNPTYYQYRQSTENFDYPTVFNGNNVYYKIYVKDSAGNENIIHTTTTVCPTTPVSLILKVDPPTVSFGAVGSSNSNVIFQTPSQNFNFIVTLTKSNGGVISQAERNVSFKIKKDLNFDNYVDITTSAGATFPTNTFNFTSGIPNASNTEIRLTISLKVDRNSFGLTKPSSSAFAFVQAIGGYVQAINGNGIKVTMTNIAGNVTTQSDTLIIQGTKYVWS